MALVNMQLGPYLFISRLPVCYITQPLRALLNTTQPPGTLLKTVLCHLDPQNVAQFHPAIQGSANTTQLHGIAQHRLGIIGFTTYHDLVQHHSYLRLLSHPVDTADGHGCKPALHLELWKLLDITATQGVSQHHPGTRGNLSQHHRTT